MVHLVTLDTVTLVHLVPCSTGDCNVAANHMGLSVLGFQIHHLYPKQETLSLKKNL